VVFSPRSSFDPTILAPVRSLALGSTAAFRRPLPGSLRTSRPGVFAATYLSPMGRTASSGGVSGGGDVGGPTATSRKAREVAHPRLFGVSVWKRWRYTCRVEWATRRGFYLLSTFRGQECPRHTFGLGLLGRHWENALMGCGRV